MKLENLHERIATHRIECPSYKVYRECFSDVYVQHRFLDVSM